jgi:CheY-like chemotaxis protein
MPGLKASILIVEDEESVRASLAEILKVLGHRVRCAADGLAALVEINQEIPEILLFDLNMPGMSGFELLPLVRLQFPIVRVIAMSGAFCGHQVPDGVTADAFYAKGNGVAVLLKAIESLPVANRQSYEGPESPWTQRNGQAIKRAMPIQG